MPKNIGNAKTFGYIITARICEKNPERDVAVGNISRLATQEIPQRPFPDFLLGLFRNTIHD
ncbi:MAG: hypothetical protein A3G59_03385 [Candidatus Taylorbacteria bacterium RIFCSPLOWO2_12_FULL_47_20]|uniref:Uncharacterized protein n=2 Tax=Candidatus Tayloriibacteriota TaxID=1817919 RepID=A0A1G2PBC5_9BACT|nr:MAG: hypothetical protein A3H68_02240 [Candidatus Taylorbacteria bacterium RIFCSPLOWO2_02_FULL_46_40]OHA45634.1 MAG: hypothetical protein A3G59_03385 [Candidatus Taylorbacteria bacterium RIFCSPLOWO2_12_FULL_47_20]